MIPGVRTSLMQVWMQVTLGLAIAWRPLAGGGRSAAGTWWSGRTGGGGSRCRIGSDGPILWVGENLDLKNHA